MENSNYLSPTMNSVGEEGPTPYGFLAIALAIVLGAVVYEGIVLVNYGVGINVGGGVNVAAGVNALVKVNG